MWQPARLSPTKKPRRIYFKSREDARAWIEQNKEPDEHVPHGLTREEWKAVRAMRERHKVSSNSFSSFVKDYLIVKEREGLAENTLKNYKHSLNTSARWFADQSPASIKTKEWEDKLMRVKNPTSRNNYRTAGYGFYEWLLRREIVQVNPIHRIPKAKVKTDVQIYSVEEMEILLFHADDIERKFLILGAFCGLRSSEIMRLQWKDIDLEKGDVYVRKGKTGRDRIVTMEANVKEMLVAVKKQNVTDKKPILREMLPTTTHDVAVIPYRERWFYRKLDQLSDKAGVEWKPNALRHSYGSYHLAAFENADRTAMLMGHTTSAITYRHYRKLVTMADAMKWWAIV